MSLSLEVWPCHTVVMSILLITVTLYALLVYLSHQKLHRSEPPIIHTWLPYVGHLCQMALSGGHSIRQLGLEHSDLPIFTLPVPFSRLYVVTSPSLAAAIQRRPTAELSFNALLPDIVQRVMGLDGDTRAIVERGLDSGRGEERGFLSDLHEMLVSRLGPGITMDALTLRAAKELDKGLNAYADSLRGHSQAEDLLEWVRRLVSQGTAQVLYGSRNPIALYPARRLEEAFWNFDHGLGSLLMGLWPRVTARKAHDGREALVAAFREYIGSRHYEAAEEGETEDTGADAIVLERIRIARSHGFSIDGIARSELSFLFAGIVNTATTTFWMLTRIFADHELLYTVREELAGVTDPMDDSNKRTRHFSLKQLSKACPMLNAIYKEVLRMGSNNFSTRLVKGNTVLTAAGVQGEVWLGKGGIVQIAGGVMHGNPTIWGADVGAFNPARHLKVISKDNETLLRASPAAFRAFGGGRTMCPGRHFATGEILSLVASVVMRFDMEGLNEDRQIKVPEVDDYILPIHILEPVAGSSVKVRIRTREGNDGRRFSGRVIMQNVALL